MTNADTAHKAGLTLPDDAWLDGFDEHYDTIVEPRIRLPQKTKAASRRTLLLGYIALASTAVTLALWLIGVPSHVVGLMVVITGTLVVGAIQLRMAGTSLGARETRNFIVASMASLLNLQYREDLPLAAFARQFHDMGDVSATSIARCVDHVSGRLPHGEYQSAQLMGGTGPALNLPDDRPGTWLGIPVASLWDQYTVDGVLCECRVSNTPATHTISCDDRVTGPPHEAPHPPFAPTATGDEIFDARFSILTAWPAEGVAWLTEDVRIFMTAVAERFGPCTLHVNGQYAYLSMWLIGDAYEVSSLGFALRRQAHSVAEAMRVAELLSQVLNGTIESD